MPVTSATVPDGRAGQDVDQPVPPARLPYAAGLDGLRAYAVVAVILYHAAFGFISGGFLGVEVFFVISGYLITSILMLERERSGTIDLKSFWIRRARRLLPALFVLLALVVVAAVLFARDSLYRLPLDVASALTYSTNWMLIFRQDTYFEAFARPSLLLHLWSLAIEEQFYVIWPPVFLGAAALFARRTSKPSRIWGAMLIVVVAGIVASTALMWVLFTPFEDPSRIYFGTDTRAAGILVGVALAFVWQPWRLVRPLARVTVIVLNAAGFLALAGLTRILLQLAEYDPALYEGGFITVSLLTAIVIAATVYPGGWLGRALGMRPLVWVGKRSYGLYLYHWPVFALLRPELDVPWGRWPTLAVQLALTFAIAEASYRWVEEPIRQQGFRAWAAALAPRSSRFERYPSMAWPIAAVLGVVVIGVSLVMGSADAPADVSTISAPAPQAPPSPATDIPSRGTSMLLIGDSVMLDATSDITAALGNEARVEAVVSRQMMDVPGVIAELDASVASGGAVLIHLGTNGPFGPSHVDEIMAALPQTSAVYFVSNRVPRRWQDAVNQTLAGGVARWDRAHLVDWYATSEGHREYFTDGVHLSEVGLEAYVALLSGAMAP